MVYEWWRAGPFNSDKGYVWGYVERQGCWFGVTMKALAILSDQLDLPGLIRSIYAIYEGLNMANQKSRKLGVFGRKSEATAHSIGILVHIRGNKIIMFI